MPDRKYEIEADDILPEDFAVGRPMDVPDDPGALAEFMLKAAATLEMVGGTFSVVALRRELPGPNGEPTGLWVPDRYVAKWDSFAPGGSIRRQQEARQRAQAEPDVPAEPEPEPPIPAPPVPEPDGELTPDEMADHFPEEPPAEPEPEPEPAVDPDGAHPSPDPDVDPTPPGSSGFDMNDLLGAETENVLAEIS